MSISFDVSGFDDLNEALGVAQKQFPASAEKILKKEARNLTKDIKKNVAERINGHGKKAGSLERGFKPGRVILRGSNYTSAVVSDHKIAPHYHLVEEGHELWKYSHWTKGKDGKRKWYGKQKHLKAVRGKKIVAQVMARRSEYSELIAMELLDSILEEAGLK